MQKYYFILISAIFLVSCSHSDHHESDHEHKNNFVWEREHKKIKHDHQKALALFRWFEKHIDEHENEIKKHNKSLKRMNKSINKMEKAGGLKHKKAKLNLRRLNSEMTEEHRHFLEDHEEFMKIVHRLMILKKELSSHEGHHHH